MFEKEDCLRSVYDQFGSYLTKASVEELNQMQEFSRQFFINQGVTFTVYNKKKGVFKGNETQLMDVKVHLYTKK